MKGLSKRSLKEKLGGQRITAQRRLLLELIRKQSGHLDADELYRLAREREPRLSLSTVYRSLTLFKKLGLVEERHFDQDHHHYEPRTPREHYHLLCLGCGKVVEFQNALTAQLKEAVSKDTGFKISASEIHLQGLCLNCLRRAQK